MIRAGILVVKETGQKTTIQGEEHRYVRCVLADDTNPERRFECRVLDVDDVGVNIGEPIQLQVQKVVTDRRSGVVRFDCTLLPPGD
ncbi:hypothetical protein KSD_20580 [Ktedonobacter sp. SOSP1-85]|uniref:hypothetical protein n=1 Tax=Ktedonobacter sp. SOSP1-85 TaxID=2778367 RepID=UPI001914F703|nr:hypothetical protein [Ktedonobacter sp. SOSP1-85]GHO74287.1 hypothetical protein KSD_20580 [Ktedonobacter sp. SOSP1-85]